MSNYQPLTPDELRETALRYYEGRARKAGPVDQPSLGLVGAQPGAGKTFAAQLARAEYREQGGFVHVDADRMRERIDTKGTQPTSSETQRDAGALAVAVRSLAMQGRRNVVEEGTFRSPEQTERLVRQAQQRAYRVELLAVATPREESVLGIFQRFEAQHAQGSLNPRFVDEAYHDEAMDGFARTVAQAAGLFDRVRVIDRQANVLFDSADNPSGKSAIEALTRHQQISDARLVEVEASWQAVRERAEGRGASTEYLSAIDRHVQDVTDTQKGRIHFHALRSVDEHLEALRADPRYSSHSSSDLVKVAYYRGFHQKAYEFKGKTTDFVTYDATMADRVNAAKLPDVAELAATTRARDAARGRTVGDDLSL